MNANTARTAPAIDRPGAPSTSVVPSRILLIVGAVAGPIFAAVATAQVLLRDGFDLRRHPLSQLATGGPGLYRSQTSSWRASECSVSLSASSAPSLTASAGVGWLRSLQSSDSG